VLTAQPLSSHLDADFEMLPAGPTVDVLLTEVKRRCGDPSDGTDPERVAEFFAGTRVDLTFDQALPAAKVWQPDLIVYEYCDFVGPLVATVLQCPATKLAYGPAYDAEWDDAMARRVAPHYWRMGLQPTGPVAFLDTCPPSLQVEGWARPTGHQYLRPEPHSRYANDWVAPDFSDRNGLPTILITLGTVFHNPVVLSLIFSGLADLNVNIIATVGPNGDAAEIDVDPSRVRIVRFVPLDNLLTSVSAVVAHGGAGTVLASLSRGLPLVLLPQGADQFLHARQVAFAHAGIVLLPNEATPAAIRSALQQVLTNASIRGAAQDLAEEIAAMDSPDYVIEKLDRKLAIGK
jgi:UDP:flavonoid glycosyltransferase YjiC (YdhE family)